ncbi:MAG: hypothetical protein HKP31_05825 [Nitrosopumilus sp.]|nr:hypothetical protein [Nitrosopumilus sp.]
MTINQKLLEKLMEFNKNHSADFLLDLNENKYNLKSVSITNSPTPVNEPTTRGGVYFSEKYAYKMQGTVEDLSVVPLLTKKMLGPNTEFSEIKILTTVHSDTPMRIEITTNLTNSVQTPKSIELSMVIVDLKTI